MKSQASFRVDKDYSKHCRNLRSWPVMHACTNISRFNHISARVNIKPGHGRMDKANGYTNENGRTDDELSLFHKTSFKSHIRVNIFCVIRSLTGVLSTRLRIYGLKYAFSVISIVKISSACKQV